MIIRFVDRKSQPASVLKTRYQLMKKLWLYLISAKGNTRCSDINVLHALS